MAAKRKMNQKIDFKKREGTGKGVNRKIRAKNAIPVVLYGPNFKEGLAGTINVKEITPIANSPFRETTVVTLVMEDGSSCQALLRDVQRHPLTQQIRHIDFFEVVKGHKIKVEVPVYLTNRDACKGVKDGGVIDFTTRAVIIEIEPSQIPDEIEFDVKDLDVDAEVFVKDLALPEGAAWITEPDTLVLHIVLPRSEVAAAPAEEEKEVEVVAKGKKEE